MSRRYDLLGGNALAFNSKEPEVLLASAAGTGKSLAWLLKCLTLADKYPGARILLSRKTRESLTESVLVTWERDVLGPDHAILRKNPTLRRVRQSYRFPNGSEVVVGGLDKPDKILSSEWDLIVAFEATELDLVDWETLGSRLRAGRVPFQQLAADCNPTSPHHFLFRRQASGLTRMYTSYHKDNPRFFDRASQCWTAAGLQYLARLERMTGARRDRFLDGKWVAAEGVVYDYIAKAPPHGHLLPSDYIAPREQPRVWSIDWGKTAPTCLLVGAVDQEGRIRVTREVYKTRLRPDVLGKRAKEWIERGDEPRPRAIVCDHDEERKADFEKASGLQLELADKKDRDKGIEALQARFDITEDGPRVMFREGMREHAPDSFLVDSGRPTCCLEELVGYVWDEDFLADEPIAENDHACFVAGTLVSTARGQVPIEQVRVGDWALTRAGLRPVVACGLTSERAPVASVVFDNTSVLTGTTNHPIWKAGTGFVRLDAMRYGDSALSLTEGFAWKLSRCRLQSELFGCGSTESFTAATRPRNSPVTGTTSGPAKATYSRDMVTCTATCGPQRMGRFPRGTKSITSTATRSTTTRATCNCCPRPFTTPSTRASWASGAAPGGRACPMPNGPQCWPLRRFGTARQKDWLGTQSTCGSGTPSNRSFLQPAISAGVSTQSRSTFAGAGGSAPTTANQRRVGALASTTSCASAGVAPSSPWTNTAPRGPAPSVARVAQNPLAHASDAEPYSQARLPSGAATVVVRVVTLQSVARPQPVFNLTVAGQPEFFANGILVHNCDALRYMARYVESNSIGVPDDYDPRTGATLLPREYGKIA